VHRLALLDLSQMLWLHLRRGELALAQVTDADGC
jgi:hypothetical protein